MKAVSEEQFAKNLITRNGELMRMLHAHKKMIAFLEEEYALVVAEKETPNIFSSEKYFRLKKNLELE